MKLATATPELVHRELVVVADDLGVSAAGDRGVFEAFREGIVTTSSLLVNGATSRAAAAQAAAAGLPLGLHLNLSEGRPVSAPGDIPSLVDAATGRLLGKFGFRAAAEAGRLRPEDVARETRAQVRRTGASGSSDGSGCTRSSHSRIANGSARTKPSGVRRYGPSSRPARAARAIAREDDSSTSSTDKPFAIRIAARPVVPRVARSP